MSASRLLAVVVTLALLVPGGARVVHAEVGEQTASMIKMSQDGLEVGPGLSVRGYVWKTQLRTAELNIGMGMGGVALRHRLAPHVWTQVGMGLAGSRAVGIDDVTKLTLHPAVFFGVGARVIDTEPASVDLLLQGGSTAGETSTPVHMAMLTFQLLFR